MTDVDGTNHGGVRWFEMRKAGAGPWSLHQEGTVAPDSDHRWMGAISMNGHGDMALMYNITSNVTSPSIGYSGRRASDPLGTMPRGEHRLPGATGSGFNNSSRWGDYSAMSVDPVDDATFWFTGMYAEGDGTSDTRIGAVVFDDHGNDAGSATLVGSFSTTSGDIETAGDVDWFTFVAEAGAEVTLETSLNSLSDTTLTLFDSDGTTVLDFNDDINFPANLASLISWGTPTWMASWTASTSLFGTVTNSRALRSGAPGISMQMVSSMVRISLSGTITNSRAATVWPRSRRSPRSPRSHRIERTLKEHRTGGMPATSWLRLAIHFRLWRRSSCRSSWQ